MINQNGIYKDPNFKELITNDPDATSTTYMKNARVYRYTYVVSEDRYYLDNVSLLK
jgi:hypothetical protein